MNNNFSKKTLLSIDDEVSIQRILQHYFKDNFLVVTKVNGKDGLCWMQEGNIPDLIITDIDMPQMNGFEFISQIRSSGIFNQVPIVILSGNDSSEIKIRCLEAGADDYMIKPFNPHELSARINNILRRKNIMLEV